MSIASKAGGDSILLTACQRYAATSLKPAMKACGRQQRSGLQHGADQMAGTPPANLSHHIDELCIARAIGGASALA